MRVPLYRNALFRGVAAAIEHLPVLDGLRLSTVLDVGANKGQFSLVARQLFPDAAIVAFEPLPDAADLFSTVFAGDGAVTLFRVALGEREGSLPFHVSRRGDNSSLLQPTRRQEDFAPGTGCSHVIDVPVRRLDALAESLPWRSPVLLKLDVQGFEREVLAGAEAVLERVDFVLAELSFAELYAGQAPADAVIGWLHDRGFRLTGMEKPATDRYGRVVQGDFLFCRMPPW